MQDADHVDQRRRFLEKHDMHSNHRFPVAFPHVCGRQAWLGANIMPEFSSFKWNGFLGQGQSRSAAGERTYALMRPCSACPQRTCENQTAGTARTAHLRSGRSAAPPASLPRLRASADQRGQRRWPRCSGRCARGHRRNLPTGGHGFDAQGSLTPVRIGPQVAAC